MKRAVVFYSLSGNTKEAAECIAKEIEADLIQIDFVEPMPKGNFARIIKGGGLTTFGRKPEVTGIPENICKYDEIILGLPVWAGKAAAPINTLLAIDGVADKVTAVFTFSGGGDNAGCIKHLSKTLHNIKVNVALADKNTGKAAENADKLQKFVDAI